MFLQGKRILITGVANERSIAAGIAKAMHKYGAELAFTYQNEKIKSRVEACAESCDSKLVLPCDVATDTSINDMFNRLKPVWPRFDGIIHAIAFAPKEELKGNFVDETTRNGFSIAHDISAYSFIALAKAARTMLNKKSSLVTLSYLGAERAVPNYNVMGVAKAALEASVRYMANALGPESIRVNAISAGPIRTLAASGISDFKAMLANFEKISPLRRLVTQEEVGNVAAFLCSELATAITGEIMHVDCGFNIAAGISIES